MIERLIDYLKSKPGQIVNFKNIHLVYEKEHMESILMNNECFGKGGGLWKPTERLLGKDSVITMPENEEWKARKKAAYEKLKGITEEQIKEIVTPHLEGLSSVVNIAALSRKLTGNVIMSIYDTKLSEEDCKMLPEVMELLNTQLIGSFLPFYLQSFIPNKGRFDYLCNRLGRLFGGAKRDEVVTMFVAGTDTTASTLTWHILTNSNNIEDTLSKYPPIWFFPRICQKSVSIEGHKFNEGDLVILFPIVRGILPFGAGSRKCVGEKLASLEIEVISKMLRDKYTIDSIGDLNPTNSVTLWPKDARARLMLK